jgi:hypothetical protein
MYLEPEAFVECGPDKCQVTVEGITETLNIPLDKFLKGLSMRKNGEMIQFAFPTLSKKEREFLLSGMSFDEQDQVFQDDEDDEMDDEDDEMDDE